MSYSTDGKEWLNYNDALGRLVVGLFFSGLYYTLLYQKPLSQNDSDNLKKWNSCAGRVSPYKINVADNGKGIFTWWKISLWLSHGCYFVIIILLFYYYYFFFLLFILHIGLTSHYCFRSSGSHLELDENITQFQARSGCTIIQIKDISWLRMVWYLPRKTLKFHFI